MMFLIPGKTYMISRIYLKLVKYFIILIVTTCVTSVILFFITVGYPLTKDFHRLIRKQAKYIGYLAGEMLEKSASPVEFKHFLNTSAQSYETDLIIFDSTWAPYSCSTGAENIRFPITDHIRSEIEKEGIYVQMSHLIKPVIYILPMPLKNGKHYYICIHKNFSRFKQVIILIFGLIIQCGVLILAIYPLSKEFTRPLTQLTHAAKEVSEGNFSVKIDEGKRDDELGDLLRVFCDMRDAIDTMIESKKVLLADISHELRSPLGRMNIAAELIKETNESSQIISYIDNIEYEIRFMDHLLKQLSEYSILNLPSVKLKLENIPAKDIVTGIYKRYEPAMKKNNIKFHLTLPRENLFIRADRPKINQVFCNLLDNAIKATPENGEIRLGVVASGDKVECYVTNTGQEISPHLREKIFDPLFRTDPSRNRKTGGLGLGLAISKKIIDHHHGKIFCHSENGVTRFSFFLS